MSLLFPHTAVAGADSDLKAARSGSVLALLSHLGVLQFSGEDAETFLQAQLSCDVAKIGLKSSAYGAHCSPKGRMLANFLLWREEAGFFMALSRDITAAVRGNISRFVLRSKVKVSDASDTIALAGVAGPQAEAALCGLFSELPKMPHEVCRQSDAGTVIRLKDGRFVLSAARSAASALQQQMASLLQSVDARAWRWLDIRNGL